MLHTSPASLLQKWKGRRARHLRAATVCGAPVTTAVKGSASSCYGSATDTQTALKERTRKGAQPPVGLAFSCTCSYPTAHTVACMRSTVLKWQCDLHACCLTVQLITGATSWSLLARCTHACRQHDLCDGTLAPRPCWARRARCWYSVGGTPMASTSSAM